MSRFRRSYRSAPSALRTLVLVALASCSKPGQPELQTRDVELGHDIGVPTRSLSMGSYGYAVRFEPDCADFVVKGVSIYGGLYGQSSAGRECELRITDGDFRDLYDMRFPWTSFAPQAQWLRLDIPDVAATSPFYVMLMARSSPTDGVSVYCDETAANAGSGIVANWVLVEWPATITAPAAAKCNWMIRVNGAAADPSVTVTRPFPPQVPSWESLSFEEAVSMLDTPQKLSQSLLFNMTSESHYDPTGQSAFSIASPRETYANRRGACGEFAVFACYVLQQHGYDARILVIKVASNPGRNHAVCVFTIDSTIYTLNNGTLLGPYPDYQSIASHHDSAWTSYQVYDGWENFAALGTPDLVVPRS